MLYHFPNQTLPDHTTLPLPHVIPLLPSYQPTCTPCYTTSPTRPYLIILPYLYPMLFYFSHHITLLLPNIIRLPQSYLTQSYNPTFTPYYSTSPIISPYLYPMLYHLIKYNTSSPIVPPYYYPMSYHFQHHTILHLPHVIPLPQSDFFKF